MPDLNWLPLGMVKRIALRKFIKSGQGNVVVADYEEVESPSPTCSFANIKIVTFWFWYLEIEKVKGNLTCLKLIFNYTLKFNLAQNNYYLIINSREDISCHSLNFIHLLSYNNFNKWCVGETVQQLYK